MPRNKDLNQQMRAESRAKILATAGQLFAHQGFFNVRIAEIAKAAEMSPGNIYWYFSSKEEILRALLEEMFIRMGQILSTAEQGPGSGLEKLNRLTDGLQALMGTHGSFFQIYLSILAHGGVQLFNQLGFDTVAIGRGYHQHLTAILTQAMDEGALPIQDNNTLSMLFFGLFNGLLITYGPAGQAIPPETLRQAVVRLLGAA